MKPIQRREFLKLTGAVIGGLTFSGCFQYERMSPSKPNIIFVLVDDLGYGDLGCYGQQAIKTPHIDRMAAEGARFVQHYAGSTVCAPSRCSLLTGLHTGHSPVRKNEPALIHNEVTVAALLKDQGYATAAIGKWGIGHPPPPDDPKRNGFDYFFGYLNMIHAHNYYPEYLWRNDEQIKLRNTVELASSGYAKGVGGSSTERIDYTHDLFTQDALTFIETHRERPFFLYLAYTIPHANNEYALNQEHGMEVPDLGDYASMDWPDVQKAGAAMISRMDRDMGVLLDTLRKNGLDDKTIVFFSSDNGPHAEGLWDPAFFDSNGPLRGKKRDLYEGGIRVPLIARWPGTIPAGTVTDHVSAFWDFLPTACELAGTQTPEQCDGISYLPALKGKKAKQHPYLYWEFYEGGFVQAVRFGKWKVLAFEKDKRYEVYNLDDDLQETNNLVTQRPDIVEQSKLFFSEAHKPLV